MIILDEAQIRTCVVDSSASGTSFGAPKERAEDRTSDVREAAALASARASADMDLALLWGEFSRGECRIVDGFFSDARCYLVLAPQPNAYRHRIEGRRLAILHAVLRGLPQTNVAIDLGVAPSTVALNSKLGMEGLGVIGKPSRAHPLLMLSALAAHGAGRTTAEASSFTIADRALRVVSARRPDCHLSTILPQAEMAVIRRLVEGCSYVEIASERGTSRRTIANQITAVFRRLRVSGRSELMVRLLIDEGLISAPPSKVSSPPAAESTRKTRPWLETRQSA